MRIASIVVIGLLWSCPCLVAKEVAATPFAFGPQGGVLAEVMINGTGPHQFLVDTGASHSSISDQLALVLGVRSIARTTVVTPVGSHDRFVVQVDRLKVGPITMAIAATAVPAGELKRAAGAVGVLGQDVLAGLSYTIDYRRQQIRWNDPRDRDGRGSIAILPLAFHDGLPMVELPQREVTLTLVADSGAGGLVLFAGGGPLPGVTTDGGRVRVDVLHGGTVASSARIGQFRVGGAIFRDVPAVLLPRPPAPGYSGDGLLPLRMFSRVTFDGPSGRLILG